MKDKERTPGEATAELRKLYAKHGRKGRGNGGLTQGIIAKQVGISQVVTVTRWIGDSKLHADPQGNNLKALCEFLDKAKNKDWLAKLIKPQGAK